MSIEIKKKLFFLIPLLIMVSMLFSCSHPVEFNNDKDKLIFNNHHYVYYNENTTLTYWYPLPTPEQIEKIDTTKFELSPWALKPIYATKEDTPNFIIVSYDKKNISEYWSTAYIRGNLRLSSVFETEYANVEAKYDSVEKTVSFDNIPQNTKFDDMIDNSKEPQSELKDAKYYCSLYCSYPEIEYLKCSFSIMRCGNEYYLVAYHEPNEATYYLFNQDLLE